MAYEGLQFIFDGVPSQRYGLTLAKFDSSSYRYKGGSDVEVTTFKAPRSPRQQIQRIEETGVLEFDLEMFSDHPLQSYEVNAIATWMFGQNEYKKLIIQSPDYSGIYFNCILNNREDIAIQNGTNGFKFTVQCDAGGAWTNVKTRSYTSPATISVINKSALNDYTYPDVEINISSGTTAISLINTTDSATRATTFTLSSASSGETLKIDGASGEISSSISVNHLAEFNKVYPRLKRGNNSIIVSATGGSVTSINFLFQEYVRLGA